MGGFLFSFPSTTFLRNTENTYFPLLHLSNFVLTPGYLGGPPRHGGGDRDRDQGGGGPVSRLRGAPRLRLRELGLEPGGQPPAAQRGQPGQLPPAQQCAKVPGADIIS